MILPIAFDWLNTYAPAALAVWNGQSPYDAVPIYFAAPWATLPLIPFALMPYSIGRICVFILGFCTFSYTAYKMGAKPAALVFFLLSYPVLSDLYNGNIDWMPMLGFVLPPQVGLIFVLIKPQIGIGITIYWLVESWRGGGLKLVLKTFMPVILVFLVSCIVFGFWPLNFLETLSLAESTEAKSGLDYNSSLWPYGLIIGFPLLAHSIYARNKQAGIMASPFLSPYTIMSTYGASLVALINNPIYFFILWVLLWAPVIFKSLLS
jgi:hypothetical protein